MGRSVLNILSNYGRRHFKLFTNCHVSWGILKVKYGPSISKLSHDIVDCAWNQVYECRSGSRNGKKDYRSRTEEEK